MVLEPDQLKIYDPDRNQINQNRHPCQNLLNEFKKILLGIYLKSQNRKDITEHRVEKMGS